MTTSGSDATAAKSKAGRFVTLGIWEALGEGLKTGVVLGGSELGRWSLCRRRMCGGIEQQPCLEAFGDAMRLALELGRKVWVERIGRRLGPEGEPAVEQCDVEV